MNIINLGTIIAGGLFVLLGLLIGFGKSLKLFTKGIFGVFISFFACAFFGGAILGFPSVSNMVAALGDKLSAIANIFVKLKLHIVIFYIVMFVVVQIIRLITVKFICAIFEANNPFMKIVNKILGAIASPMIVGALLLLVFAVFRLLSDTSFVQNILLKLDGTYLGKLYEINPIVLSI